MNRIMNTKLFVIMFLVATSVIFSAVSVNFAHAKFCDPSGCKGTKGYYTKEGHHHCWKGSKDCVKTGGYSD